MEPRTNTQRFCVTSTRPFEAVVAAVESAVGHPDIKTFTQAVAAAKTNSELEQIVQKAIGASGFMEFIRFDMGEILRKERGTSAPRSMRLLIGNPLIMKQMVVHVPDAASYAPVTILIDERTDGVCLSYDKMTGFLAPYGNAEALKVAQDLDSKVEALLTAAAKP